MRPIRLTMQAFGSYGAKTVVDFTKPAQSIFLITGDTGSGKSTIFDAIVFALYGEASSNRNKKDGMELQSQYVDYSTEPYVELEFSERSGYEDQVYTVKRIPRHMRPLKKGSGLKDEPESVCLTMPDGSVYPQKETDKKLEEIVGLSKTQFMQVAMIAQGEFMDLLRAKSEERKPIFRKLFNTELYQRIVDELAARRKNLQAEMAQIRTACQTEAAHITVPENYENSSEMLRLRDNVIHGDRLYITDLENLMAELEKLNAELADRQALAEAEYQQSNIDYLQKRDALNAAGMLTKQFEMLEMAREQFDQSKDWEEQSRRQYALSQRIASALELQALWKGAFEAAAAEKNAERNLKALKDSRSMLESALNAAQKTTAKTRSGLETELAAYSTVSEKTAKAIAAFREIAVKQKAVDGKRAAARNAEEVSRKANEKIILLDARRKECSEKAEKLADAENALLFWEAKQASAERIGAELEEIVRQEKIVANLTRRTADCRETYKKAAEKFANENGVYEYLRTMILNAQAGFIAKEQLFPGKPCPVCGSLEHPNPCQLQEEHRELTREMLDEKRIAVDALREAQETAAGEASSAAVMLSESQRRYTQMLAAVREKLSEYCAGLPENADRRTLQTAFAQWNDQLSREGELHRRNAERLAELKQFLKTAQEQSPILMDAANAAREKSVAAGIELTAAEAELRALMGSLEYASEEAAKQELVQSEEKLTICRKQFDAAAAAEKTAQAARDNAEAQILVYSEQLPELGEKRQRLCAEYQQKLDETGMPELQWQELAEQYDRSAVEQIRKAADDLTRRRIQAESEYRSACAAVGEQVKPDMEELQKQYQQSETVLAQTGDILNQCRRLCTENRNALGLLAPKLEERGRVVAAAARLDNLYNLLAGKVTGSRMDIETFVQRYYLERILYAANRRFLEMTAGQFELRMYDLERAGEGKNHGLDLMVYSTVTGKVREIGTLSGGESFMAALAMALGMADQIQSHSAAVNLDMMFIDEGFGSLSENARNQAVRVLKQMAGDAKLIGLISHVSELKQELGDQLIVSRDEFGSHVAWQNH